MLKSAIGLAAAGAAAGTRGAEANERITVAYGTGDLGNDGVHRLDVARWALETAVSAQQGQLAALPAAVSTHGGKYYFCHVGNAAWRAGRTLRFDPQSNSFTGDAEANRWLTRPEYRAPWRLPKIEEL